MSSATAQTNGKKSSNSSAGNTPASTPVMNGNSMSHSTPPPPNNNAPKYGTLVPNRIFVGGISASTTEGELLQLFSGYGTVKAAKIIQDRAGVSKGYGFITFESEDDAKRPLKDADNIVLKERKLNIAPAIKKQPFNRAFDASSPPAVAPGNPAQYFFPPNPGVPYFQGGVAYYAPQAPNAPGDPNSQPTVYQAPPVYPGQTGPPQPPAYPSMMFPQTIYMPQQYPMHMPYDFNYYPNNGGPPYMVANQNGVPATGPAAGSSQGPPMGQPNSPPRPPCYNPQLHYNPDTVFYNLPVYGGPIEGTPVYENMDIPNNGYSEGPFASVHELEPEQPLSYDHTQIPPPPLENNEPDTTRQTKTPVVSLLSMEHNLEKDFISMQGGRRVKQPPPPSAPIQQSSPPAPQSVVFPTFHNQPPLFSPYSFNSPNNMRYQLPYKTINNNRDPAWRKPRPFLLGNPKKNYDSSSRSSIRTDSNSSANAVDENKNEEKVTAIMSPPPVTANSQNNFNMYNGSRTYQNSLGRRSSNKSLSNNELDNNNRIKNNLVLPPQMRGNGGQQSYGSSAARRGKRSSRRNVQSGGSLSEIGAGDAPLPNPEVTDTCKKFETLKL